MILEGSASSGTGTEGDWGLDLSGLVNDAVAGMAFVDNDGRYLMVNPAFCRLLGRRAEELLGRSSTEVTHPDDWSLTESSLDALRSGEVSSEQVHKRYVRPDGSVVWAVRTTTVLRDHDGRPAGLFTQVVDVTAAVAARESLSHTQSLLQAMMAHASELTVLLDRRGVITYASPASFRLLGYTPEELTGRSAFDLLHPDELDRAREAFAHRLSEGDRGDVVEYRVAHRDGAWRHAEIAVITLLDDPGVEAVVVHIRDITDQKRSQQQLEANERRFRALVANSWDIITVHDMNGDYQYCSPAITGQLGYQPEELVGRNPFEFIHPDDMNMAEGFRDVVIRNQNGRTIQYRFPHKDGTWRWVESVLHNRLEDPAIGGVIVTSRDITFRRRRDAQQAAIAELSNATLAGGPVMDTVRRGVELVAEVLGVEYCAIIRDEQDGTHRALEHFGPPLMPEYFEAEIDGRPRTLAAQAIRDRATVVWNNDPDSPVPEAAIPHPTLKSGAAAVIFPARGSLCALSVYSTRPDAFSNDDISFLESMANVMAAAATRHRIEQELRQQALHDGLTGLPNRVLLIDRLRQALSRLGRTGSPVAVLFVDVDNFKLVNDSLGHPAGDVVVAAVAQRIRGAVRGADTVARFGGDELVVVSEDTDEDAARDLAERLRACLASPLDLGGRRVTVTASIGYAVTSNPGVTADDILAEADAAMYAAKQSGKDRSMAFSSHMRTKASAHLDAVTGIRRALDCEEFRIHFQPIVDAATGTTVGHEALLRWEHPTEGLIGPASFLSYAEESGLIIPIGEWVLKASCAQSAAWRKAGSVAHVSVNVSPRQLLESDIVATVAQVLECSGIRPEDLWLELTENAVMTDLRRATAVLAELRELGVHVGMDDFGTGHSSLSQLARLPLDFVKIDQSFIRDADRDRRSAALLETIATLARVLDLAAIAEGVEREDQLQHLRTLGIPLVQGYLFGRPAPAVGQSGEMGRPSLP